MRKAAIIVLGLLLTLGLTSQALAVTSATTPGTITLERGFGITVVSSEFTDEGSTITHRARVRDKRGDGSLVCARLRVHYGQFDPILKRRVCDGFGGSGTTRVFVVPRLDPNSGNAATRTVVRMTADGYSPERGVLNHPAP